MEEDDRFKHLASDPRFKNLRRKQRKVVIDERFQSMFTDERFTLNYTQNKRGYKYNKSSADDLKKYYALDKKSHPKHEGGIQDESRSSSTSESSDGQDNQEEEGEFSDGSTTEVEDQEENRNDDEVKDDDDEGEGEGDDTSTSDLSSSSDESESEEEGDIEAEQEIDNFRFEWQPLDHDAEKAESSSKRLAIQNLDWDHIDVKDLFVLIKSIRMPMSVKIYISEFGKDRLAKEEIHGPQEIVETPVEDELDKEFDDLKDKMRALKNIEPKGHRVNEYEDADEEMDIKNEELRERIRRYQLNRLRYYYAIAEFDSVESAELVYKELDGIEYEGSSLELDLRFVPDNIEFDSDDLKAECNKVPDLASYEAPQFINSALQQTTVKFTWDQTDIKRSAKLQRSYTKQELEKDDLEAYLASETDSDESEDEELYEANDGASVMTATSQARIDKYKNLLKNLEEEEEKKKKVEVDVEWGDYDGDEMEVAKLGKTDDAESDNESKLFGASDEEVEDDGNEDGDESEASIDQNRDEGLDLLVMDSEPKNDEEFQFNPDDERFKAIYDSALYNIDPSHPNFKRTKVFDLIAERKRMKLAL